MRSQPRRLAALLAVLFAGATGCDGCPGSKPYTPYTLDDGPAGSASGASPGAPANPSTAAQDDAGSFAAVQAVPAPGDGKSWTIEQGAVVAAPAGRAFTLGLVLDVDGDGKRDLVAWAQAPDGMRGELTFAPGARPGEGRTIAALPGDLSIQGCSPRSSLAQVGPRSIAFDFAPQCGPGASGRATRWVAVLRFGASKGPELAAELRVGALPEGESLDIAVDARDRDGDARDDIAARLTLSGGLRPFSGAVGPYPSLPPVSAVVAFFDRPAGMSRDPSEPEASLQAFAAGLMPDARKKDTAPKVAPAVHQLRRLWSILCDESGRALITTSAGPVRCGDPRSLEEAFMAEATAGFARGDAGKALAAIGRLDALPSLSDARKKEIQKLLAKNAPASTYQLVHRAAAVPASPAAPGWGPLTFDAGGDLLVRTAGGVVRVDRTSLAEAPASMASWPSPLAGEGPFAKNGWVLAGVEQRCDSPTLLAVAQEGEADRASVTLPILGPVTARGLAAHGRCTSIDRVPVAPIAISQELGLLFAVGPEVIALKRQGPSTVVSLVSLPIDTSIEQPPGGARSPEGATVVLPTSRGLLITTAGGSTRLWSAPELEQASACTPASGAARIACVGGGTALLYEAR